MTAVTPRPGQSAIFVYKAALQNEINTESAVALPLVRSMRNFSVFATKTQWQLYFCSPKAFFVTVASQVGAACKRFQLFDAFCAFLQL